MFDTVRVVAEVRLAIPPGHGQLRLWGKDGDSWYALIEWQQQCTDHRLDGAEHRGLVFCTGWVAAEHVARLDGQDYRNTPRIRLHPDPQRWPTRLRAGVPTTPSDYYLGLLDGQPIPPPPGIIWMTGMGSLYG
jgi:hypothetical protein